MGTSEPLSCPHCARSLPLDHPFEAVCPSCGRIAPDAADSSARLPERIARYEIRGVLGQGGMGRVFLAWDPQLERDVAVKVLSPECTVDERLLGRFRREARLASALNHPHICTVHDMGEEGGRPFLVMEHVVGRTLSCGGGERSELALVLHVGSQVAEALAAAHAAGVVHRDIKPSNVMVRDDGVVKVVDFGLARAGAGAEKARVVGHVTVTEFGTLVGTLGYMSPEQARGREVDGASDVFSLGVVLYELATGLHPFRADSPAEVFQAILSHTPPPADRLDPGVPAPLAALIERMLERDPALRPSAAEVAAALDATRHDRTAGSEVREPPAARHTVGRRHELGELRRAFDEATEGRGSILCLTGEPGIGKTTLMEDFLASLRATDRQCRIARGRCSERLAGAEAYLPMLEALEDLLRGEGGDGVAQTLKAIAPSWYAQVVPLAAEDSALQRALRESGGLSQERLKRELCALVVELSRQRPLLLLIDDVHWADASTVDLVAYVAPRIAGTATLLVVSYRPAELQLAKHPFGPLKLELQAHGVCREVALDFLQREDIERYLELEFPGNDFPAELGNLVHARTEGSPLFMGDLLRYLRDHRVLVCENERWTLGRSIPDIEEGLPESVRSMIQRKIEQLDDDDLRLLLAASVQGNEFDSTVVAEALELDAAQVEERLTALDGVRRFVREVDEHELPDGVLTLRYRFVHVLYQNALHGSLRPARRTRLSKAVANALVRHHGEDDGRVAAELALLFEGAREPDRATHFYLLAARHAVRVFANREAATLAQRGLERVRSLPASEARDRTELAMLVTLGPPLKDTRGWAAPEVIDVYARANELGERIGATPDLFPALWGMWLSYSSTADVQTMRDMCERMLAVARESGDAGFELQAHHALSTTLFIAGDFAAALHHADRGRALYDQARHGDHAYVYGGHDPGSCCACFAAQCLWALGHGDRALERAAEALANAEALGHPVSLALVHWSVAWLHTSRRDVPALRRHAELCREVVHDQGAPIFPEFFLAWADAQEGGSADALERMRAAFANAPRIPVWWAVVFHGLMAEVQALEGRIEDALASIATAYEAMGERPLGQYLAELHRLEGVFLLACEPARPAQAERALRRAVDLARSQGARLFELRALVSLGRALAADGRGAEIRADLADRLADFTEGLDTPDLREAAALLATLS